jgi:hypothetical protein
MRIRLWNVGASSLHKIDSKAPHRLRYLTHPTPLNCATNDALPRPSAASSESFITKKVADQNVFWYRNDISASVASVVNPPATSAPSDGSNLTHDGGNFGGSSGAINRPVSTRNSSLTGHSATLAAKSVQNSNSLSVDLPSSFHPSSSGDGLYYAHDSPGMTTSHSPKLLTIHRRRCTLRLHHQHNKNK